MITCNNCGSKLPNSYNYCIYCSQKLPQTPENKKRSAVLKPTTAQIAISIGMIAIAILILIAIVTF